MRLGGPDDLPDRVEPGLEPVPQRVGLVVVGKRTPNGVLEVNQERVAVGVDFGAFAGEPDGGGVFDGSGCGLVDAADPVEHGFGLAGDEGVKAVLRRASSRWCWTAPVGRRSESGIWWAARHSSI